MLMKNSINSGQSINTLIISNEMHSIVDIKVFAIKR